MDQATKREIRQLASGSRDPRRCVVSSRRRREWLASILALLSIHDMSVHSTAAWIAGPFWLAVIFVAYLAFGVTGMFVGFGLFALFIASMIGLGIVDHVRLGRLARAHDHRLCVWCRHPLAGAPERGVCPECGLGYDARACETVLRAQFDPVDERPGRRHRLAAWARLVRERDRSRVASAE